MIYARYRFSHLISIRMKTQSKGLEYPLPVSKGELLVQESGGDLYSAGMHFDSLKRDVTVVSIL